MKKKKSSKVSKKANAPSQKGIIPLGDRVLVKPLEKSEIEKKSAFGIIIPETVDKEKPGQGRVVAVGEGRFDDNGKLVPVRVKVGDRVVFSKYSPDEIKLDGQEYFILSESSILAVIK